MLHLPRNVINGTTHVSVDYYPLNSKLKLSQDLYHQ